MNNFKRRKHTINRALNLTLSPSAYNAEENSGSVQFTVMVNNNKYTGNATILSDSAWATVNNVDGVVTVNYTENTSGSSRTAVITVYVEDRTATFTLNQRYIRIVTSLVWDGKVDGHKYVTIGDQKWAINNVGALVDGGYGGYYAWGETTTKNTYTLENYSLCNGSATTLTKYNDVSEHGVVDNKVVLESSDDAAYVNMGSNWKTPTKEEFQTLLDECRLNIYYAKYKSGDTTISYGLLFISRTDSSKYVYIPYAAFAERFGARWGNSTTPEGIGDGGDYLWTSSLYIVNNGYGSSAMAWDLDTSFLNSNPSVYGAQRRHVGLNVRGIADTTPTVVSRTARVVFSNKLVPNVVTNQFGRTYYAALVKGDTKQCDISETLTDQWEVPYNSSWYWDVDAYCDILLYTNYSDGSQDVTTIDTDVLLRIRYNEWYNNFTLSRGSDDGHFYIHADFEPTSITGLTGYPELNGVQVSYPSLYSPTNANIRIDQYLSIDPQIFDSQDSMQYVFELDKTDPDNPKLYISKIRADYLTYNS